MTIFDKITAKYNDMEFIINKDNKYNIDSEKVFRHLIQGEIKIEVKTDINNDFENKPMTGCLVNILSKLIIEHNRLYIQRENYKKMALENSNSRKVEGKNYREDICDLELKIEELQKKIATLEENNND